MIISPGDLITTTLSQDYLSLAQAVQLDPVVDGEIQWGTWFWMGGVLDVNVDVCIAISCIPTRSYLHDLVYVLHPQGIGWADTSEVELLR